MTQHDGASASQRNLEVLPGGRIARMAAIEGESSSEGHGMSFGAAGRKYDSSSEANTPESRHTPGSLPERSGSLSGGSALAIGATGERSPGDTLSSPETAQSEQLNVFKDYYSQEEIQPGDLVSTLWAYQPRAQDEHELDRGDMLKVVGIWDDGWATGVRVRLRAEDWRGRGRLQRDSGMSNGSSGQSSPEPDGEVRAFPLVCVCLPQHWRNTIEGGAGEDTTLESTDLRTSP